VYLRRKVHRRAYVDGESGVVEGVREVRTVTAGRNHIASEAGDLQRGSEIRRLRKDHPWLRLNLKCLIWGRTFIVHSIVAPGGSWGHRGRGFFGKEGGQVKQILFRVPFLLRESCLTALTHP